MFCALALGVALLTGCATQPPVAAPTPTTPSAAVETAQPQPSPSPTKKRKLKEAFTIRGPVFVLFLPTGWTGEEQVVRDGETWRGKAKRGKDDTLQISVSRGTSNSDAAASAWIKSTLKCDSATSLNGVKVAGVKAKAAVCETDEGVVEGYAFVSGGRLFTLKFVSAEPFDGEEVLWILERMRLA